MESFPGYFWEILGYMGEILIYIFCGSNAPPIDTQQNYVAYRSSLTISQYNSDIMSKLIEYTPHVSPNYVEYNTKVL